MKIILQLKALEDGTPSQKSCDSEEEAIAFLKDRPKMTAVIGVANAQIDPDVDARLRAALRPLDDEEKKAEAELEKAMHDMLRKRAEEMQKREAAAMALERSKTVDKDPNAVMKVRFLFNEGLQVEQGDPRQITDEVRKAVDEWVAERNTWVESRGQVVGDARIEVYPGELPEGVSKRIVHGTFVPVAAPADDD